MTDLGWCTYCDSAVNQTSNSLCFSEECLQSDALLRHPLTCCEYLESKHFPKNTSFIYRKQTGEKTLSNFSCKSSKSDSNMTTNASISSSF